MKMKAKKPTKKTCQSVLEACSRTTETSRRRKSTFGPLLLDIFGQSSVWCDCSDSLSFIGVAIRGFLIYYYIICVRRLGGGISFSKWSRCRPNDNVVSLVSGFLFQRLFFAPKRAAAHKWYITGWRLVTPLTCFLFWNNMLRRSRAVLPPSVVVVLFVIYHWRKLMTRGNNTDPSFFLREKAASSSSS